MGFMDQAADGLDKVAKEVQKVFDQGKVKRAVAVVLVPREAPDVATDVLTKSAAASPPLHPPRTANSLPPADHFVFSSISPMPGGGIQCARRGFRQAVLPRGGSP
jgi:hypothetical protein